MRERRWAAAFGILHRLIERHPQDAERRVSLAHAYVGIGELDRAITPGLQHIDGRVDASGSLRATAAASYLFQPGRQFRASLVWTNSGLQQLSPRSGGAYRFAAVGLGLAWWF